MAHSRASNPPPQHHHAREPFTPGAIGTRHLGVFNLLTAIPLLLGAAPTDPSIVVVAVGGRRLMDAHHLLLPDPTDLSTFWASQAWAMFARSLDRKRATAVTLVAYADESCTDLIREFAAACPLKVLDLLRVHEDRWYALDCPNPTFCEQPECGTRGATASGWWSRRILRRHDNKDATPGRPTAVLMSRREARILGLQPGPPDVVEKVRTQQVDPDLLSRARLLATVTAAHAARSDGRSRPLAAAEAAVLLRALDEAEVRDVCLRWSEATAILWHDLIRTAPPGRIAPVAALIAWTAYQRGDLLMADLACGHALDDLPGYGPAEAIRVSLHLDTDPQELLAAIEAGSNPAPLAYNPAAPAEPPHAPPPTQPIEQADRPPHHE